MTFELPKDYFENDKENIESSKLVDLHLEKFNKRIKNLESHKTKELQSIIKKDRNILIHIFKFSPYLSDVIIKETQLIYDISQLGYETAFQNIIDDIDTLSRNIPSKNELMSVLRINKNRIALLIAMADITKYWKLEKITSFLSIFADECIKIAARFLLLRASLNNQFRIENKDKPEEGSGLLVIAMGKLGGMELNYSSDIDLIIFYDSENTNYLGKKSIKHFFIGLTNELANILSERTKDGYVFRTDLRLRPDPISNPTAVSLISAETYYETFGQNWERAAMTRQRPVIGDRSSIDRFELFINHYVWRKFLDFASIRDVNSIKRQIDHKIGTTPENFYSYNTKLGRGGIREIEFFVQTQQLIWGGRIPELQINDTCLALEKLAELKYISDKACSDLTDAYYFLRKVEHRLQMINDQQTHSIPNTPEGFKKLALFMGFENSGVLKKILEEKTYKVRLHYSESFESSPSLASENPHAFGNLVFTGTDDDPETLNTLRKMGFTKCEEISEIIRGWHHGRRRSTRTKQAREVLTELMPTLLNSFANSTYPDVAISNFDTFLDKIPSGIQIFSLFYSNPSLLGLIAEIEGGYPYLAHHLNRSPILLDYVLTPKFYNMIPNRDELRKSLDKKLNNAELFEDVLDETINWTNDRRFRIAIQYIQRKITDKTASKALSRIADVVISSTIEYIFNDFKKKYGIIEGSNFAILAFGKLGGQELTFNSDLDLVFLYETKEETISNGKKQIDANSYFARLGRRFTNSVSSMTSKGTLYDIDLRLRPSGNDGPIASKLISFNKYYNEVAWKWEFMALTKTRVVYGSEEFSDKIMNTIGSILDKEWNHDKLKRDVLDMHSKTKKSKNTNNPFDVKHISGGMIDIDYITQFLILKNYHNNQGFLETGSTLNGLQDLQNILTDDKDKLMALEEAYIFFSSFLSIIRLAGNSYLNEESMTTGYKKTLVDNLDVKDFKTLKKKLVTMQKTVQKLFVYFI